MREIIKEYLKKEEEKLINGEVDSLELEGVCPSSLESVFGDFEEPLELNGWQCDYWGKTEYGFYIGGSMYYGTATVTLEED